MNPKQMCDMKNSYYNLIIKKFGFYLIASELLKNYKVPAHCPVKSFS